MPVVASASSSAAPAAPAATTYHGRTLAEPMGYGGADWLVRADRETSEAPERVLDTLRLTPDMQVADVGAGVGYFTIRIARRLGAGGHVYATDINRDMLAELRTRVADAGLHDVTPILCTDTDAGLPVGALDLELLVDVYHELSHPKETLDQLRAALRPGGRLVLVEYRAHDPEVNIKPEHTMSIAQVKEEVESSGFHLEHVYETLPTQRIFEFNVR